MKRVHTKSWASLDVVDERIPISGVTPEKNLIFIYEISGVSPTLRYESEPSVKTTAVTIFTESLTFEQKMYFNRFTVFGSRFRQSQ